MAHYRAYFIGQNGQFIKAKDIVEDDDKMAIIAARAMIGMHAIELWERDRKIVRFDVAHPTVEKSAVSHKISEGRMVPNLP